MMSLVYPNRRLGAVAFAAGATLAMSSTPFARADVVEVVVTGVVEFNQVTSGPIGGVNVDDAATLVFCVDSDVFVDSASFPTRGYVIDQGSFTLTMGAVVVALESPFPVGEEAYFVLRDNDPAVDGFFIATSVDFAFGVPLDEPGIFGPFINNFSVTYGGSLLSSLDILGAFGTYDFTGLTVFNWTVDDGPFNPVGLVFSELAVGTNACPSDCLQPEDGTVDVADLLEVLGSWGQSGHPCDIDGSLRVDIGDLLAILADWGPCPAAECES